MKLLGLDVGTKRIGVAKADSDTKIAVPDGYITVNGQEFAEIARLARMYSTTTFVIGLPRNNNGQETKQSEYCRNFARQLAMSIPNARIYFEDESLTSVEAEKRLKERKTKYEKGEIDAEAASIILQDFLERLIAAGKAPSVPYTATEAVAESANENDNAKKNENLMGTRKKKNIGKIIGIVVAIILVLCGVGVGVGIYFYNKDLEPVISVSCKFASAAEEAASIEKDTAEGCVYQNFEVKDNDTTKAIAENLKSAGLIRSDLAFKIYAKLNNPMLKAGVYAFRPSMSTEEIIRALVEGGAASNVFNITFLPGETIADIKAKLKEQGYRDEDLNKAFEKTYKSDVLEGLYDVNGNLQNSAQPLSVSLEGYIYGDTYQFYNDEALEKIIETAISGLNEVSLGNKLKEKFAENGLSLRDGIILASIVQKEAQSDDMPGVAQVFLNRIRQGMSLGSDVTAQYAADLVDPERKTLKENSDVIAYDSLYNTRVHTGLPPGPICSPGITALLAVANPDKSKSSMLYFLTGDDGKMYYSDTEAGHNQNIRDYCKTLCSVAL